MSLQSTDALAHRRFLSAGVDVRPFRRTDMLSRIGGQLAVDRLVDGLYDRIDEDRALRPLFPSDLMPERARQKLFFAEWLGGEPRYNDVAYASLKHKHDAVPITRALAGRWLGHLRRSLEHAVAAQADRRQIFHQAQTLALALVNQAEPDPDGAQGPGARRYLPQGSTRAATCGLGSAEHPRNRALALARRGDRAGLVALLKHEPTTLRLSTHAAVVLQAAVLAGKLEVVESLLERGVDVNLPAPLPRPSESTLFITPLCAARWKRRTKVEALLVRRGARTDVFTAALLGDVAELRTQLASDGELAQVPDPAGDVLDVTPVHHAVAGAHVAALQTLLECSDEPVVGGTHALTGAAVRDNLAMVELLLERGAEATGIGAGRWVLHRTIAPVLARAGARVDASGDWIRLSCTGNQGRKDDPEYVRALLRHGARVDDRRRLGVTATGATALHYATKAGFVKTIEVLLEHGADPEARDDEDGTPLDWLNRATRSVDRERVRRLLRRA